MTILLGRSISAQALKTATLIATIFCASCTFDTSVPSSPSGDARDVDRDPDANRSPNSHLLLSEVKSRGQEYVEIYNPGSASIDLSDYYLADTREYAFLPGAFGDGPAPVVIATDFIARFPDGATIEGETALVIAVRPREFNGEFGVSPDFHILGEPGGQFMREAYEGSISPIAALTDGGEGIALFHWDQTGDLVTDVDLIDVGPDTTEDNRLTDKTGLQVDGPDSGTDTAAYRADLNSMTSFDVVLNSGQSFHRITAEVGHEMQGAEGNGQLGHDETTENITETWGVKVVSPGSAAAEL